MEKRKLARVIQRANAGNVEAFAQIYNTFYRSVYYIGLKMTGNEQDANEVVQETMLRVHKSLPELEDPGHLIAFVNRVATNCSINLLKANNRRNRNVEDDHIIDEIPNLKDEFLPDTYLEKEEQRQILLSAVDGLNDDQKSVILLFYYKELSIREISSTLEISEPLVKTRLFRARQSIKKQLVQLQVQGAMGVFLGDPVLTKVFRMDADAMYHAEQSGQSWMQLANSLQIAPALAEQAIHVATAAPVVAGGILALLKKILIGTAIVAVVGGGAAAVYNLRDKPPESAVENGAVIESGIYSGVPPEPGIDIDGPGEHDLPNGAAAPSSEGTPPSGARANTPAPAAAPWPVSSAVQQAYSESDNITVANPVVHYAQGAALTQSQLLADVGLAVPEGLSVQMRYFETVDTTTAGCYGVYIWAEDGAGIAFPRKAVIVVIE